MYKLNRRVTIKRYTTASNEFGGLEPVMSSYWSKWASVDDRQGIQFDSYQQAMWSYDSIIVMRYETERPTRSNDVIEYEGWNHKINSLSLKHEGGKFWEIIKVVKLDEQVNNELPVDTGLIQVYNYTGTGGENNFINAALIGQTVFGAYKDGLLFLLITSGIPEGKQVLFNDFTGEFTWGTQFEPGEIATILYY